jgi:hypothetical protein
VKPEGPTAGRAREKVQGSPSRNRLRHAPKKARTRPRTAGGNGRKQAETTCRPCTPARRPAGRRNP